MITYLPCLGLIENKKKNHCFGCQTPLLYLAGGFQSGKYMLWVLFESMGLIPLLSLEWSPSPWDGTKTVNFSS